MDLEQVRLVEWEARNVSFGGARPGGGFDTARGFSGIRAEQYVDPGYGLFVIFAFATHVTYPGREVRDCDQFLAEPGEICNVS
jgi:hypothetical protein